METTGGEKRRGDMKQFSIICPEYGDFVSMDFIYSGEFSHSCGRGGRINNVGAYGIRPGGNGNNVNYCSGAQALRPYDANVFTPVLILLNS
jgi:hypothetical protein